MFFYRRVLFLIGKWRNRVSYSLLDQAFFSGSNFIVNIALIRWISIEQFGSFSIAFVMFLIASSFYNAIVFEPMSVLGVSRYRNQEIYVSTIVWIYIFLSICFSLLFVLLKLIISNIKPELEASLMGIALFTPFMLLIWLFRQNFYMIENPKISFYGSFLYFLLVISGLLLLKLSNLVSPFSAFALMGTASLLSSIIFWPELPRYILSVKKVINSFEEIRIHQWNYAKWVIGTAIFYSLSTLSYPLIIGFYLGLSEAGALRATQNLILPLQQILTALSYLFLPFIIRQKKDLIPSRFYKTLIAVFFTYNFVTLVYTLLLIFSSDWIFAFLFSGNKYIEYKWMIPFWVIYMILNSLIGIISISLRAFEKPQANFISNSISVVFTFSFGIFFVYKWSLFGVMLSMTLNSFIALIVVCLYFWFSIINNLKQQQIKSVV